MQGGSGQLAAISRKGKAMKYKIILSAALLALGLASSVSANSIKHVFVVDELTLEVEMANPLTEEELHPANFMSPSYKSEFQVNGGVHVTGLPIPQKSDGFHYNIYRLAVDGLDAGPIYQISYKGQKARTFKLYEGREQQDRYRDRYGSYF